MSKNQFNKFFKLHRKGAMHLFRPDSYMLKGKNFKSVLTGNPVQRQTFYMTSFQ